MLSLFLNCCEWFSLSKRNLLINLRSFSLFLCKLFCTASVLCGSMTKIYNKLGKNQTKKLSSVYVNIFSYLNLFAVKNVIDLNLFCELFRKTGYLSRYFLFWTYFENVKCLELNIFRVRFQSVHCKLQVVVIAYIFSFDAPESSFL